MNEVLLRVQMICHAPPLLRLLLCNAMATVKAPSSLTSGTHLRKGSTKSAIGGLVRRKIYAKDTFLATDASEAESSLRKRPLWDSIGADKGNFERGCLQEYSKLTHCKTNEKAQRQTNCARNSNTNFEHGEKVQNKLQM